MTRTISFRIGDLYRLNKYYTWALLVGIVNSFFSSNIYLGYLMVVFQIACILYTFFSVDRTRGICYAFISTSMAMDYEGYISLKSISIMDISIGFWLMAVMFVFVAADRQIWGRLFGRANDKVTILVQLFVFINISALVLGFINTFLLNDNNILAIMPGLPIKYINSVYSYAGLTMVPMFILFYGYLRDRFFLEALKDAVIGMCISVMVCILCSLLFGRYTNDFWGYHVSAPPMAFSMHCLFVMPFYQDYRSTKWWIFAIIGLITGVFLFPGGKGMLYLLPIGLAILGMSLHRRRNFKIFAGLMCLGFLGIVAAFFLELSVTRNVLSKTQYATGLLNIFDPEWFDKIPPSPKFRMVEGFNIIHEYSRKPYFLVFGKGVLGTVYDIVGWLSNYKYNVAASSMDEWNTGLFFGMHETPNKLFLSNGIVGLGFMVWVIKEIIKNYKTSPFLLLGSFWFIFFWGYSFQFAMFGCAALFLGFMEIERYRNSKKYNLTNNFYGSGQNGI